MSMGEEAQIDAKIEEMYYDQKRKKAIADGVWYTGVPFSEMEEGHLRSCLNACYENDDEEYAKAIKRELANRKEAELRYSRDLLLHFTATTLRDMMNTKDVSIDKAINVLAKSLYESGEAK